MAKSERMVQGSRTCPIRPKVSIISKTENPSSTLLYSSSGLVL